MKSKRISELQEMEAALADFRVTAEAIFEELEDVFSNRSEKWQESENGQEMQAHIESLESLVSNLEAACDEINEIV